MKKQITTLLAVLSLFSASALAQVSNEFRTKIVIQAIASDDISTGAPAFIVYPDGEALKQLEESGAIPKLEQSLERLGYTLVAKENDAAVFIRINFHQAEPYSADIGFRNRPTVDYSNSAATANYASLLAGGRYQQLANPAKNRAQNNVGSILGPNGEIINITDQEDRGVKINTSEKQYLSATVYPILLEVSAWVFEQDAEGQVPQQIWAVLASYNNLRDEETQPQLLDLCESAGRFLGKNLKKEKLVSRD